MNLCFNLHYTLLLLIPPIFSDNHLTLSEFTLHFATINTMLKDLQEIIDNQFTLHFATINTMQ